MKNAKKILGILEDIQQHGGRGLLLTLTENDAWIRSFGLEKNIALLWDLPATLDALNDFLKKFSEDFVSYAPGMISDHHFRTGTLSGVFQCRVSGDEDSINTISIILDDMV